LQISGTVTVNKVKGNFHIAAGSRGNEAHGDHTHHVHRLTPSDVLSFDVSHSIQHLSFGPAYPNRHNPLDGHKFDAEKKHLQILYMLQIVPTSYVSGSRNIESNQYSVTEHKRTVTPGAAAFFLPGVFFKYDISALRIRQVAQGRSFAHFLTRLCAIVGGVVVVLGLIYQNLNAFIVFILTQLKFKRKSVNL